jgi:glycerophosphoryl diester phosphodiesterase
MTTYLSLIVSLTLFISHYSNALEIIAHRGGTEGVFKESSKEAFLHSLKNGITTLESDLHLTADDHVILTHDPIIQNGSVVIASKTLSQIHNIDPQLMTLQQFKQISQMYPHARFQLEIKYYSPWEKPTQHLYKPLNHTVNVIVNQLNQLGLMDKTTISSFDPKVLTAIRKKYPQATLKYNYRGIYYGNYLGNIELCQKYCFWPKWDETILFVQKNKINYLAPNFQLLTHPLLTRINRPPSVLKTKNTNKLPFKLLVWTVNDIKILDQLREYKVDGIVTDYPVSFKKTLQFRQP